MKKVDSRFETMDSKETSAIAERYPLFSKEATLCHAVQAPLAMTEKKLCINKILGIAVGLCKL